MTTIGCLFWAVVLVVAGTVIGTVFGDSFLVGILLVLGMLAFFVAIGVFFATLSLTKPYQPR